MIPVLVSVLVVTCPCALSLATPAAMTAALGALARAGLIATRANAVERLALATHCLADKTGTLTEGRFRLQSVTACTGVSGSRCLALAAALERYATHPAAAALVQAADEHWSEAGIDDEGGPGSEAGLGGRGGPGSEAEIGVNGEPGARIEVGHGGDHDIGAAGGERALERVMEPATHTGGVTGRIDGVRYAVGSPDFVARICGPGIPATGRSVTGVDEARGSAGSAGAGRPAPSIPGADEARTDEAASSVTHVLLARDGALLARFVLADTLRADAPELVDGLRRRGIETTIASGDSAAAVERAARALGVARHLAGLSPEAKLEEAVRLAAAGERVLMLGDGVNDTPALAGAHVSVAMGRGAAAAAARADAVLIGDGPDRLLAALDIARRARRIVKQNLAWALGYNLVALPLAAAGAVPPWAAAVGMSLSSLAVAGNALRLGRGRAPDGG